MLHIFIMMKLILAFILPHGNLKQILNNNSVLVAQL